MVQVESADASPASDFAGWVTPHLTAMTRLAVRLAPTGDHEDVVQLALERAWVPTDTQGADWHHGSTFSLEWGMAGVPVARATAIVR